jgi:hypothetical protein
VHSVLMFNSKSKDATPGKGASESLAAEDRHGHFTKLESYKNWRKVLSAFWSSKPKKEGDKPKYLRVAYPKEIDEKRTPRLFATQVLNKTLFCV